MLRGVDKEESLQLYTIAEYIFITWINRLIVGVPRWQTDSRRHEYDARREHYDALARTT